MREQDAGTQQADPIEKLDRADAVGGDAAVDLALGLGDVDLNRDAEPVRLAADPLQRRRRDRVDRMRSQRGRDQVTADLVELGEAGDRGSLQVIGAGRVAAVDQRRPDGRPQAGVGDGARHRTGLPVHVPEAHGAGADHLDAGEPRPPVDVRGGQLRLGRPDVPLQPLHQGQVVGVAAEERHRGVGMAVDEAGDDEGAGAVDQLVAGRRPHAGPELGDRPVLDPQADDLAVEGSPLDRQRHRAAPTSSSAATAPIAVVNRDRFSSLPASNSPTDNGAAASPLARLSTTQTAA